MKKRMQISADLAQLEAVGDTITAMLATHPDNAYSVQLAVHECLTNIIVHAQAAKIEIGLRVKKGVFSAEIYDNGTPFNPDDIAKPDLENGQIHGYGLFLMHELMDEVAYKASRRGNYWRLVKQI